MQADRDANRQTDRKTDKQTSKVEIMRPLLKLSYNLFNWVITLFGNTKSC